MTTLATLRLWLGLRRATGLALDALPGGLSLAPRPDQQVVRAARQPNVAQQAAAWTDSIARHNRFIDACYAAHLQYRTTCLREPDALAMLRTDALIAGDGLTVIAAPDVRTRGAALLNRDASMQRDVEDFKRAVLDFRRDRRGV